MCTMDVIGSSDILQRGWTALLSAAKEGHLEAVAVLLQAGANLNHKDWVSIFCRFFALHANVCVFVFHTFKFFIFQKKN